jgi:hypothetical protein
MPNLIAIYWEETLTVVDQKINLFINIFVGRHLRCMLSVAWSMSVCRSAAARLLGMGVWIPVVSVVCCQVEVSMSGRSLVQGALPSIVCLIECDHEASIMRKPWPTRAIVLWKKYISVIEHRSSTSLITKLDIEHDPVPHNLFPCDPPY